MTAMALSDAPPTQAPPRIVALQLPRESAMLSPCVPDLDSLLSVIISEAACAESGQLSVFTVERQVSTQLLVPWLSQTLALPLRIGEKVLYSIKLPAIRLTPLAPDGVLAEADARTLFQWLRNHEASRVVVLTDVPTTTPLYAALLQANAFEYLLIKNEPDTHLLHRFRGSYDEFFKELTSKYRNQLRKREKSFRERVGTDFVLEEYRSPDSVTAFLDAAAAINRLTYQFRLFGEMVNNDEASLASARRAASAGAFRSFILWHAGKPLCFVLGHQRSDGAFEHRQTGYDPTWRDIAPGIVCNLMLLQHLYAVDRPTVLDFGSGDSDYKRMFSNESRKTTNPVLVPRHPRYLASVWLFNTFNSANALAAQTLQRLGIKEWIKRRLRRTS